MGNISVLHPSNRLVSSKKKIRPPFALDPTLCFYSPQSNLDALEHPRVKAWLHFVSEDWEPPSDASRRVALFLPCTKYKPYTTSREHRAINNALLSSGWQPQEDAPIPNGLLDVLDPDQDPALLNIGPLRKRGVTLDRIVMSEPLALVPYPYIYYWRGEQSPAASYDDPGLFEARGTSVSPERSDSTATRMTASKWRWGPNERAAFAEVHNFLADVIASTLRRVGGRYDAIGAWVSPGLTHRSFLADADRRRAEGMPATKRGPGGRIALRGALDELPDAVEIMPSLEQLERTREALARRLAAQGREATPAAVRAVYARGDGNDTPLGLPESLSHLVQWLDQQVTSG